jgi:threonine synthase
VAAVDGHGFTVTPFARNAGLSEHLGLGTWVKDETGNVSGSHKGRHLMGLLVHLEVVERLGLVDVSAGRPELSIASCGNAALAAAVVARAGRRPLEVFVPTDADQEVVRRLKELDAQIVTCPREEGVAGDPAYLRLRRALQEGALPFTCQGNENGLTIEGGETLGYEMVSDLAAAGVGLDRVVVQVGGGALASAVILAFREAVTLGALERVPRIHAVQTEGAFPLKRAYDRVLERVGAPGGAQAALAYAARHRSEFMWPWEQEPHSIAHGILDDETYDWRAVVAGMIESGGHPVVVDEDLVMEANAVARETTGIDVDHTGSAGLAGLMTLHREGAIEPNERVAVLFTGVARREGSG